MIFRAKHKKTFKTTSDGLKIHTLLFHHFKKLEGGSQNPLPLP